ncbi:sigma-70 family RNA polymerase sigma factor [soil metagenome]
MKAGDRPSDGALVERMARGEHRALEQVMELWGPAVLGLARRVVVDAALAEEVAQDTFIALWRRPWSFDPARGSLTAWLLGIARKKAIDAVRKEDVRARARAALEIERVAESATEQFEERHALLGALTELTHLQREAIFLAYFGGLSYKEVARTLGVPEGTAKTRLRDGLRRLRTLIEVPLPA